MFDLATKFFAGAFALIAVYLILTQGAQVNIILNSFARSSSLIFSTLQGKGNSDLAQVGNVGGIYG